MACQPSSAMMAPVVGSYTANNIVTITNPRRYAPEVLVVGAGVVNCTVIKIGLPSSHTVVVVIGFKKISDTVIVVCPQSFYAGV
jgi:hypothetical protein